MPSYLVVRLVPESPVDGGTFSTYLDGLQIQVYAADEPQIAANLLGETQIVSSDLTLAEVPWLPGTYVASVSKVVQTPTTEVGSGNYGTTLQINDGNGIAFGSDVACPSNTQLINANTAVTDIPSASTPTVTLSQSIPQFVAANTVVTFYFAYGPGSSAPSSPAINPTYTGSNPSFSFVLKTNAAATNSTDVSFAQTYGIAVGMQVTAGAGVPANTTVTAVISSTSVTLSKKVTLPNNDAVTFTADLNSGVVQHVEQVPIDSFVTFYVPVPVSVATAIIEISTPPANTYLDVSVVATRNGVSIPVPSEFYNVIVTTTTLPTPDQYQAVALQQTSFYLTLPPPPNPNTINVNVPADGTAPTFDGPGGLLAAMQQALTHDPYFPASTDISTLSPAQCTRMAYDIVWSLQNILPQPPDALESLYTNPPNPGGSSGSSGTNNLEQDRQKFEGTLNGFYSTPNANAERLTKFVAAASAAVFCEQTSLNSAAALLEFPVDPSSDYSEEVESELLLEGLGVASPSGLNFGVPAAFFYALGANLDKSTSAAQRFQIATGDAIERLLQQFATAENAGVINDLEPFANTILGLPKITSFQAARRLVALAVSAASTSPSAMVFAGTPLAKLVGDWLSTTDPTPTPTPNPPLTYQNTDFNIWTQQLDSSDPQGYLYLDLDALTQGYVIPPFTASPGVATAAGNTLTFDGTGIGIGAGMPVSGNNIAPGTTVTQTVAITTVQLSKSLSAGGVKTTDVITFNSGHSPITASPNVDIAAGTTLTFFGTGGVEGISTGMAVSGTNIPVGTLVTGSDTVTTVTLSSAVLGNVPTTEVLAFNCAFPPVTATTSADCPPGSSTLTFAATNGINVGMAVFGLNIPAGTIVQSVVSPNVTLSAAVAGDVPIASVITFATVFTTLPCITLPTTLDCPTGMAKLTFGGSGGTNGIFAGMTVFGPNIPANTFVKTVASPTVTISSNVTGDVAPNSVIAFAIVPAPSTLADQIAAWLPSTTSPPTPNPTVTTLKQVTATEWTDFFTYTKNASWLPPFTQPVAPGSSPIQTTQKAGYIALRIRAFIRAVHQFFTVSSAATSAQLPAPGAAPVFDLPAYDPIAQAASYLPAGFQFGNPIAPADLATAVQNVFADDLAAQEWLSQAITTINELFEVASGVANPATTGFTLPNKVSFSFSVVEALYARGFRSASDITKLSADDFQQALTGTVAYDFANSGPSSLYQKAQGIAPSTPPAGPPAESFQPINPNGSLVNCVPPPCLSPTGPIAYLQEMLKLSQASTCRNPFAPPPSNRPTLGDAVSARRGPLGSLMASCANLETPLPLIDIVNESLEYLGATQPPAAGSTTAPSGTVYDTSADQLAGHTLCEEQDCCKDEDKNEGRDCHDPAVVYAAMPEYSTPATPVTGKNDSVEPLVYNNLKVDFSSCCMPYSQALDVSRTYLRHLGTCRFEELRTFRKCITEFALDPANPPAGFQSYLWRYPVRIDTAIEYLGITPEEYSMLFQGTMPQSCGTPKNDRDVQPTTAPPAAELYGYPASDGDQSWTDDVTVLSEFLSRTCLTYCEFLELAKCGFTQITYTQPANGNDRQKQSGAFPECEPCCLANYHLQFPDGYDRNQGLYQLIVFIRLWKKLKDLCGAGYTFQQLYDICTLLTLFNGAAINPEFIRQLAAFQMLRDHFHLPLVDPSDHATGTTGADRTHLLALWVGNGAKKWRWAISRLLEGVESHARTRYDCRRPRGEGIAHMADNLDALSRLAGFNPPTSTNPSTDTWNSNPGCTLRFAEVLAKICASDFRIGELLYLFNAVPPHDCEDPFGPQDPDEALNYPLDLPENDHHYTLWELREALLKVEVCEEEICEWTWPRIVAELRDKFGYVHPSGQHPLLSIGQHFFPDVLEASGFLVSPQQRQYRTTLTSSTAWNSPPGSPFQYDASSTELWIQLPVRDEAVAAKLSQLPQLNGAEQAAVQDLYFAPRLDLALLKFLFPDWQSAEIHLIQEREEEQRWSYFRRHFALANARRKVIVEHLANHVTHYSGCRHEDMNGVAALVLSRLLSDENTGTPWESDSGVPPTVMWTPPPSGGAIAALLGLIGTGLLGEYEIAQAQNTKDPAEAAGGAVPNYQTIWREVRGPLEAFDHERDVTNSPIPTVLPALGLSLPANPLVALNNGYALKNNDGQRLGGAEAIRVRWSGVLLVEREGEYAFHAGAPTPEGERPDFERGEKSQWRVTLKRGQKTWTVLNHQWPGDTDHERNMPRLRRGAYQIEVDYSQPAPDFTGWHIHPQRTGFQLKYAGPDTEDCLIALPVKHLYRDFQDQTLDQGITFLAGSKNAQAFLKDSYTSTLRDIRRTYQRAFKAVLFAGRFALSAWPSEDTRESELGYMLDNPARFAGYAYYRTTTAFTQHLVDFNFNFLPLLDNYHAPIPAPPDRSTPSLQQTQAMFDWWERVFDYDVMRQEVHRLCNTHLWRLFYDAQVKPPTDPAQLLEHIGSHSKYWDLDLRFYQDQNTPIYSVTSADLQDDRWLVRAWHADRWIRRLLNRFHPKDISKARPDVWASQDPSALVPASGVSETGNANLTAFVADGCLANGEPRRYLDLKRLNDGLRERGRDALICYLCSANRVALTWMPASTFATAPLDLSDLLLLDVETGICEKASRIDEAISAVQAFFRRSRLGLEPTWKVGREFARLWDSRFETYRTWERCKRRELYRENWIEWEELGKARRIEAFRFLETELRNCTLTLAAPGGLDWWADDEKPLEHAPKLLQRRVPSELQSLSAPPQSTTREGLATLGSPEYAARPTWLAAVPQSSATNSTPPNSPPPNTPPGAPPPNTPPPVATPAAKLAVTNMAQSLAQAAANGSAPAQTQSLPFWMESAMKLGTQFVRVAAAGVPQAALVFVPHGDEPQHACCCECGQDHPILVDEYYFWLVNCQFYTYTDQTDAQSNPNVSFNGSYQFGFQDSYYDRFQQQSAEWNDEDQVPPLLAKWQPNPAVRLAWCRVHNGQFCQARKSEEYVAVSTPADLVFLGRGGDSLYFQVSGETLPLPPGYSADTSPPGFRYDLPSDHAVVLPQVAKPPAPTTVYPGGLLSYPFYAYDEPGTRLFPRSWFSPAMVVAEALRGQCNFELALQWYKRAFNPLSRDCAWMRCQDSTQQSKLTTDEIAKEAYLLWEQHGRPPAEQNEDWFEAQKLLQTTTAAASENGRGNSQQGACCDSTKVTEEIVRNRAVTLHFCQTLLDWSEALMRCRRSPEAFQQARLLCDTVAKITGRRPQRILLEEPAVAQTVSAFTPAYPPLNPRLMDLYSLLEDRLGSIHTCLDARRLHNGRLNSFNVAHYMRYFGDSPFRDGWRTVPETCAPEACGDDLDLCCRPSPYRFTFQIQKAIEIAGRVRELEAALLSAYEKGDAEALASIRAGQERELLALGLTIRQDQWRDADWQVQALQQTKDVNQAHLIHYNGLYQNGLINNEIQNLSLATNAMQTRTSANITEAFAESFKIVPDFFVGAMSTFSQIPIGTKLAGLFETIGKVMQTIAEIQSATAAIDMTNAGWERRSDEWFHQTQTLPIEIQQIELQILGAQRRRDQALQELNDQQRQIENSTEVLDFLRDKFTATDLYLWLQKETAALHSKMYRLAHQRALEAQHAFNFELGHTTRRFIPEDNWDNLHEGLMAGERLEFALRHMEKVYHDENIREYELTKHFSLRLHFPMEFLRLKMTGRCEIDIPEWMFDLDYPGQYMRRIKNVTLTIPCVTGPYSGVHCRATLLSSLTRIDPRLEAPANHCCCECSSSRGSSHGYEACPHDPRIVRSYAAREAIATSSGQNDSGLFELNFHDDRYLPFEFQGAVSRWRIELPQENNYFPMETLTDVMVNLNFTAREGGGMLLRAASEAARKHFPGSGWCFFDVRHEFPDAWQLLRSSSREKEWGAKLDLRLDRKMFPFIPGGAELSITKMAILFSGFEPEGCERPRMEECPCPQDGKPACRVVEFTHGPRGCDGDSVRVSCIASEEWPDLYYGILDAQVGPLGTNGRRSELAFRFPVETGELERIFLLCRYELCHDRNYGNCGNSKRAGEVAETARFG
jgi:Tc toxin complex TcA C-terminal TcB-binding domain/Protein of unknown function (DUF2934)